MPVAIDVALLLPAPVAARVLRLNARLEAWKPGGLRLDATHLPHITLVQLFADEERLGELCARVTGIASRSPALDLTVRALDDRSGTLMLVFEENAGLRDLHDALTAATTAFRVAGDGSAFETGDDLPARDRDVEWVSTYGARHSGERYLPHVTVGHGRAAGSLAPFSFRAERLAVCHLGRHCTCRAILAEERLGIDGEG